jgi:ribonuclease R
VTHAEEPPAAAPIVCEVGRRGRLLVAEPFFEFGVPLTLGRRGVGDVSEGDLVAVEPDGGGRGRVIERLGRPDDVRAVLRGVAIEQGAAAPWPEAVEQEVAALGPDPAEGVRVDLRDRVCFTVDPPDARDFDDAIGVEREDGGFRLFVHIADVSARVPAGSALDAEAALRGCSVYLPGMVEPMLPERLSADLCSLRPDVDRAAVTVEVAPDGAITAYRSLIRSRARLSYPQAERILAGEEHVAEDVERALHDAAGVAARLRDERFAHGAAHIEAREVEFELRDGRVAAAHEAEESVAHQLVEELMLLANRRVAELLSDVRAPAIYRVHPQPDPVAVESLVERLAALEVPTPPQPELHTPAQAGAYAAAVAESVARYVESAGRGRAAFPPLVLRALERARYDTQNLGHSGLAFPAYCHFTSPIRRYPDLVCHRALVAHLGQGPAAPADEDELRRLADASSHREREAALVERRGDDVCLAFLLEDVLFDRGWDEPFTGEVVGLIAGAVFVRFGEVFQGMLPAGRLGGGERWELDRLGVYLAGLTTGARLRLGDGVRVRVRSIDRPRGRVLLNRA